MFSRQEFRSCTCPQDNFWHERRPRASAHRSISPNTISSEPMIAETSASMCPRLKKSIACRWANEGARILHLVGPVSAVRDQVDAELALGRLDRGIDLAGGYVVALGIELEMVDSRLHRALHFGAQRRDDLVVPDGDWPLTFGQPQLLQALLHDAHRLAHLFHSHEIAVVAVAVLADWDVEIEFGIALVGLRLAQVPGGTGAAHHHAGESPVPRILQLDHGNIDVALLEYAIVGEQARDVVTDVQERIAERPDVVEQLGRQVLVHSSDTEIIGMHARARGALVECHQLLALLETPERRCEGADVQCLSGNVEKVREQASDFAVEHADKLSAFWNRNAEQFFHC